MQFDYFHTKRATRWQCGYSAITCFLFLHVVRPFLPLTGNELHSIVSMKLSLFLLLLAGHDSNRVQRSERWSLNQSRVVTDFSTGMETGTLSQVMLM